MSITKTQTHTPIKTASPDGTPTHVAVIMDGNGRWAAARGLPRLAGHREGASAVRRTVEAAMHSHVSWLTLYAFSSENWRRPQDEVSDLTGLLRSYLRSEIKELNDLGVRIRIIGERERFDAGIRKGLEDAERATAGNTLLNLNVALSYGARAEILHAARRLAAASQAGQINSAEIDETALAAELFTAGMPDPDLVIRTSGEQRLSNFLLWQSAYAELMFLDVLWPDFNAAHFAAALAAYAGRERRFGARPG